MYPLKIKTILQHHCLKQKLAKRKKNLIFKNANLIEKANKKNLKALFNNSKIGNQYDVKILLNNKRNRK